MLTAVVSISVCKHVVSFCNVVS